LAGAGLRVGEVLALERRDVNLAKGTLFIGRSKTEAGVRTVDLIPALRDELATYLAGSPGSRPTSCSPPLPVDLTTATTFGGVCSIRRSSARM
jgi:integrase